MPPQAQANKWNHPLFKHWVLPAILLAGMLVFDWRFLPGATITPLCSFLVLVLLAFILPPLPMIFWACAYTLGVAYVIYHPEIFRAGLPDHPLIHKIRTVSAIVAAAVAVLLCFNRLKSAAKSEQLNLLVKEIPVPFVLSDGNGEIVLMNKQAAQLLGVPGRNIEGESFFSLLTDINRKGDSIQKYLEVFDAQSPREVTIELKPQNNPGAVLHGTLIPADGSAGRYLITIISEPALA